jgi:hypothetical protein
VQEPGHIVFYWTGRLPDAAALSIISALNKSDHAQVHVYLDQDVGFESFVPVHFDWLRGHPRLRFVDFFLSDWVKSARTKKVTLLISRLRRLFVAVLNSNSLTRGFGESLPSWVIRLIGFWHPIFGWKARTEASYAIRYEGPQFRGDVFRVLLAEKFPGASVLYADLDVYFSKKLGDWGLSSTMTYRGGANWANTAILFYHQNREQTRGFLGENFRLGESPLPWFMFTDENCLKAGIEIRSHEQFDPGWSQASVSCGDSGLFFRNSPTAEKFLKEIREKLFAVHWHNQWSAIPDLGSPFQILSTEETLRLKIGLG